MSVNSRLKAIWIITQRKALYIETFYIFYISESSCAGKKTLYIGILVTSRYGHKKIMQSFRIMSNLPQEYGSGTSWASSDEHLPNYYLQKSWLHFKYEPRVQERQQYLITLRVIFLQLPITNHLAYFQDTIPWKLLNLEDLPYTIYLLLPC